MTTTISQSSTKVRGLYRNWQVSEMSVASGGQATLYDIPDTEFIYKKFRGGPKNHEQWADLRDRLRELSAFGHRVFVKENQVIGDSDASSFSWPVDVIETDKVPVGVVMPKATTQFYREGSSGLRTLEYLYLYRCNPPDSRMRVAVLIRVLRAFHLLADMQMVHGDLAPKNIVWALRPGPSVLVLDVDGLHKNGAPYWEYVQTNEWEDPRVGSKSIPGHDLHSDWYALSLLIMRVLLCARLIVRTGAQARRKEAPPLQLLPNLIAARLETVFSDPLSALARPSPREWAAVLSKCFFPSNKPNVEAFVRLDLAVAQWRRFERRSGNLGPPFADIRPLLS